MINHTVVGFMIGANAFCARLITLFVHMKVCHHTATTSCVGCCSVVFTTAAVCAVCSNASWLMDTTATILMLVAMLATFACATEPFKTKLI